MYFLSYHRAWHATHCGEELEVLAWRQQVEKDIVLRTDSSHATYCSHIVGIAHIVTEYESSAGCRCGQTRKDVKEGGFAGTVVTENGGDLTFVDSQIDAIHRFDFRTPALVERFVEISYSDCFAAFHFAHHRFHIAIRLLARNEGIRFTIR